LFPNRQPVPELWELLYRRRWETPLLENNAEHDAVMAY
jgi:hypothetical protein